MPPPNSVSPRGVVYRRVGGALTQRPRSASRRATDQPEKPTEFKIIVLGDSGVGKSSLIRQFVRRTFDERLMTTVGCDFSNKLLAIDVPSVSLNDPVKFGRSAHDVATPAVEKGPPPLFESSIVNGVSAGPATRVATTGLQIWDTAGGERHNTLGSIFYRGADGCMLVYDVTSRKSFIDLGAWATEFQRHVPQRVPTLIIANKFDAPAALHEVSREEAEDFCRRYGFVLLSPDWCSFVTASVAEREGDDTTPSRQGHETNEGDADASPNTQESGKSDASRSTSQDDGLSEPPTRGASSTSALRPLDTPLRPAHIHATATSYASAEAVFATMALELMLCREISRVRAADGPRLALIDASEVLAYVPAAKEILTPRVRLPSLHNASGRTSTATSLTDLSRVGAQTHIRKRGCEC